MYLVALFRLALHFNQAPVYRRLSLFTVLNAGTRGPLAPNDSVAGICHVALSYRRKSKFRRQRSPPESPESPTTIFRKNRTANGRLSKNPRRQRTFPEAPRALRHFFERSPENRTLSSKTREPRCNSKLRFGCFEANQSEAAIWAAFETRTLVFDIPLSPIACAHFCEEKSITDYLQFVCTALFGGKAET